MSFNLCGNSRDVATPDPEQVCWLFPLFVVSFLGLILLGGCTSFRSTPMHRTEHDQLVAQNAPRSTRGVPVRLKVPSHLTVTLQQSFQVVPGVKTKDYLEPPMIQELRTWDGQPVVDVVTKLEYTEKVFTIDFPRPISGSLNLGSSSKDGLVFDSEQYFSAIRGSIDDDTIEDLTDIVSNQVPKLPGNLAKSSNAPEAVGADIEVNIEKRVLAFQRFDISQCGWEQAVQDFIDQHLNQCNQQGCQVVAGSNGDHVSPN